VSALPDADNGTTFLFHTNQSAREIVSVLIDRYLADFTEMAFIHINGEQTIDKTQKKQTSQDEFKISSNLKSTPMHGTMKIHFNMRNGKKPFQKNSRIRKFVVCGRNNPM
jgi:hypothetical protein